MRSRCARRLRSRTSARWRRRNARSQPRLAVDGSGRPRQLALRRRARRRLGRPPRLRPGTPARDARRDRLADGDVSLAPRRARLDRATATADPGPSLIGATDALGPGPRHRRPGRQDRTRSTTASTRRIRTSIATGFSYPAGFPKGNTAYTTPKVIVARAFPSPSTHWKYADKPFDPALLRSTRPTSPASPRATTTRRPTPDHGAPISGVAPKAYLGNYKALTVPTADFGLDGNSPEIAKAIDQAVADGMNVINLSIGEPEVEPRRDIVVKALDNAAAAGVVPVVAAGNDFDAAGLGSIGSPAQRARSDHGRRLDHGRTATERSPDHIADFSSAGPDAGLAPAEAGRDGAGRRRPVLDPGARLRTGWTARAWPLPTSRAVLRFSSSAIRRGRSQQVKSALASTGDAVHPDRPLRRGLGAARGRRQDRPRPRRPAADLHRLRPRSAGVSCAAASRARRSSRPPTPAAAALRGTCRSTRSRCRTARSSCRWRRRSSPERRSRCGSRSRRRRAAGDGTGFVVLTRGSDVRRVAFWFHVEVPRLQLDPHRILHDAGPLPRRHGRRRRLASRPTAIPSAGLAPGVPTRLGGPGAGVPVHATASRSRTSASPIVSHAPAMRVSPRLVAGDDENRVVGYTGIPASAEPVPGIRRGGARRGSRAARRRAPTSSSSTRRRTRKPGRVHVPLLGQRHVAAVDPAPRPHGHDRTADPRRRARLRLRRRPAVAPREDRREAGPLHVRATACSRCGRRACRPGKRAVTVSASDYQETKNMEDVGPVLPNTRVLHTTVTLHR